ncbi:hypothetical protein C8J57DRAFT_1241080 [Mycena rebaudengoi]|nr:hypothetical protein C8J57DRAFT_1241080 [Mycena rebaudengoi]
MQHVQKGCLARPREDIASNGSRIEGSHKGWNSIQRSMASGLALHSHHIALVNHTAARGNDLLAAPGTSAASLQPLPQLQDIKCGATFGLVKSAHTDTFGGLFTIKREPEDDRPTNPGPPFLASIRMMDTAVRADIDTDSVDIASSCLKRKQISDTGETSGSGSQSTPHVHQSKKTRVDTPVFFTPSLLNVLFMCAFSFILFLRSALHIQLNPRLSLTSKCGQFETRSRGRSMDSSAKLTRSRYLFTAATGINPLLLKIVSRPEFFLFMDMRIIKRITNNEHKCPYLDRIAKSGSTKFWEKHCNAVSLVNTESNGEPVPQDGSIANAIKQTCTRCKTIKYLGPAGSPENHKKASCSDGFKPTLSGDAMPIWPLPSRIFTARTKFHPLVSLAQVRELYQRLVLDQVSAVDLSLEEDAFFKLVKSRVVNPDNGAVLFKMLKDFDIPAGNLVRMI